MKQKHCQIMVLEALAQRRKMRASKDSHGGAGPTRFQQKTKDKIQAFGQANG